MVFLVARGVPSIIFMVLFFILFLASAWLIKSWGLRSGFLKVCIFCAIRLGATICGVIVAADNFGNVNVITAEIVLTQIGSFIIYYALVSFYHSSAKYFGFWQTDLSKLIFTLQHLTLYALIALAIASGVEGSDYTDPSSVSVGQKLAQAYGILFLILLTVNAFQWGALWVRGNIGGDTFAVCCTIALVFVYLKAIYLVAAAFVYNISLRNPFINAGWYAGAAFAPDFLASLLCVIGGYLAAPERKEATREYDNEVAQQQNGGNGNSGRYNWATSRFNGGSDKQTETSYSRA